MAVPTSPYQSWPQQISQLGGAFSRSLGAPQKPAPPQPSQGGAQINRQTGQGSQGAGQGPQGTVASRTANWLQGLNRVQQGLPQGQTIGGNAMQAAQTMGPQGGAKFANDVNRRAEVLAPGPTGFTGSQQWTGGPGQPQGGVNQGTSPQEAYQIRKAAWQPTGNSQQQAMARGGFAVNPNALSGNPLNQNRGPGRAPQPQPPAAPGAPTTVPPQQQQAQQQSQAQQMAAQMAPQQQAPQGPVVTGGGYRPAQTSMQDQLSAMLRQQPGAM